MSSNSRVDPLVQVDGNVPTAYPDIVVDFMHGGCRRLGVVDDPARAALRRALWSPKNDGRLAEPARTELTAIADGPARTALSTPAADAFIVVDQLGGGLFVRARSLMSDGYLIETIARDPDARPTAMQPASLDHLGASKGRIVTTSAWENTETFLSLHDEHIHALPLLRLPRRHDTLSEMIAIWHLAAVHSERVTRRVDQLMPLFQRAPSRRQNQIFRATWWRPPFTAR